MDKQYLEKYRLYDQIACIDFKSFYASVECVKRGLDPMSTKLIVCDESRGDYAITLAVTPALKKLGINSRSRLHEIPKYSDLIIAKPKMSDYLNISVQICKIYLSFIDRIDMYVYSVDEVFLNLGPYLNLYKTDAFSLIKKIMQKVYDETGIPSAAGIGPNMLIAKFAMDTTAKKMADSIAVWTYDDLPTKLWPISDLSSIWGLGRGRVKKLRELGIYTMGDLANFDVRILEQKFGILGEEMFLHANGIDISKISEQGELTIRKSVGFGQTLFEEQVNQEVYTTVVEMCFEVAMQLNVIQKKAKGLHVTIGYSKKANYKGFTISSSFLTATNDFHKLKEQAKKILDTHYIQGENVKKIHVTATDLVLQSFEQQSLFDTSPKDNTKLLTAVIKLREKYGKDAVLVATANEEMSTSKERAKLLGGHNA